MLVVPRHLVIISPTRRSSVLTMTSTARKAAAQPAVPPAERRGWAVLAKGAALTPYTFTLGELGPGEVDIMVTHNGLCHTDASMRDDLWHISGYPFIPGHEVVGVVAAVGPGVSHSCAMVGMRVGVGWIKESCRCCQRCTRGEENLCLSAGSYKGLIVGRDSKGGFADYLRCSADFVYAIPDGLASAHAAPLLCAGITVYAPLRRYLRPGMRCAVVGIGGLGHLALQFADALGASSVTAVDIDATKGKEASSLKATSFVHWSAFLTGTSQCGAPLFGAFDVILNSASASLDVAALLRALAPGGTLVQVGIPGDDALLPVPLLDLVFGQKQVVGSIVGGRADMRQMFALASAKGVVPMVERFQLSQVNEAMELVAQGLARYRIVLLSDEAWRQEVQNE